MFGGSTIFTYKGKTLDNEKMTLSELNIGNEEYL